MYIVRYMTPDPITVDPSMLLPEARALLNEFNFRHLPVVDINKKLIGILTDRDLRSAYPSSVISESERRLVYERVQETTVSEIMSTECVTLGIDSTLDDALFLFDKHKTGGLPVLEGEQVIGMFSIRDLNAAYKTLFGVGEKGAVLIGLYDDGSQTIMTRLVTLLERERIPFTRVLRIYDREGGDVIYVRINTFKIAVILELFEENGFTVKAG